MAQIFTFFVGTIVFTLLKKMFDPEKPYNDLPLISPDVDFNDIDILKKTIEATSSLSELRGLTFNFTNPDLLVKPLAIKEAVASSNIENINTTIEEAFQAQLFYEKEKTKPQKETLHYKDALMVGYECIKKNEFLDINTIIKIQEVLENSKGGIRKLPGTKILNTTTNETIYTPPVGEARILDLLKNFEDYYNNKSDGINPLVKLAILHYQFEAIHPFYDGNGRTGRILMVLYLILTQKLISPTLYISGFINKNRNAYYKLLENVTRHGEWKEWILFVLEAVRMQSMETKLTIQNVMSLKREMKKQLKEKLSNIYSADLLDFMFSTPFYTQTSLSEALGKHKNTAARLLNILREEGFIDSFKYKNYKIYCYNDLLIKLSS